ncbi:MAG TPA: TraR/DksA C4-type zinc finger protein [Panacibacter sp.]|nr:TraR/DksA C4-type zinc finger protein [Panacibacter sp.]
MATKKPVAKKVAPLKKNTKPAAKKAAPAKKVVTVKKSTSSSKGAMDKKIAKPVKAKSAPVKSVKAVSSKKPIKPVPKAAKVYKPVQKKIVKKESEKKSKKTVAKKTEEIKAAEVKPVAKTSPSKSAKAAPVKEVKVPKTTVKTSVPYQPGYIPLEKRADAPKPNEPLVRYSDSDLTDFRDLINKKLEAAKKELNYLQGLITRKDDMGSDDNDNRYMTMEDGSMSMEREQLSQMASRQITYIDHLEKAIIRIENKTYGICRVTGKLIDKARLRAVPHATLSLEAKLGLVKTNEQ